MRHKRWLDLASKMSKHSEIEFARMGSVIVRSGNVLATGFNKHRNDISLCERVEDAHVHAEIDAMSTVENLAGSSMYVSRIQANNTAGPSMPCWRCAYTAQQAGVRQVIYINGNGQLQVLKFRGRVQKYHTEYRNANQKLNETGQRTVRKLAYEWATFT